MKDIFACFQNSLNFPEKQTLTIALYSVLHLDLFAILEKHCH